MRLVRLQWGLALLLAIGIFGFSHAHAAVSYNVGVCDPRAPTNCIKPASDGSIAVTGGGGGGGLSATATTTPTGVAAGTGKPLQIDTANSGLRTEICIPGTTTCIDPTAPSGVLGANGTTIATTINPFPTSINGTLPAFASTPTFNCGTGCAPAGSTSNGSSGVAPQSANSQVVAYMYTWNGSSWDQGAPANSVSVSSAANVTLTTNQAILQGPNLNPTFSAAFTGLTPAASATDFLTITRSTTTKVVRLTRLELSCTTSGTPIAIPVELLRRSTVDTAGTPTTQTTTPVDATFTSPVGVIKTYTANPTLGTLVGALRQSLLFIPTTAAAPDRLVWTFNESGSASPAISDSTGTLALNFNAATLPATASCNGAVQWMEN